LLVTDRGSIPLRPGKPNRSDEPAVLERLDTGSRHPDARDGSSRREPSRAATRSGCARTCSASVGHCGRMHRRGAQLADLVGGDVRIFDVPYWKGPAELIHLLRSSRRSPTISWSSTCPYCLSGCGAAARLDIRLVDRAR
jgi:hypothetical protein